MDLLGHDDVRRKLHIVRSVLSARNIRANPFDPQGLWKLIGLYSFNGEMYCFVGEESTHAGPNSQC